jgi:hypothetical protein
MTNLFTMTLSVVIAILSSFIFIHVDSKLKQIMYTIILYSVIIIPLLVLYDSKF